MHYNIRLLHSGQVGNWKEWFTVAQHELMNTVINEHLTGSMFTFKYELWQVTMMRGPIRNYN